MPGLQNTKSTLDFLGTLGTKDRGDAFPNSAKALVESAAFLIETASDNLQRSGHVATGDTISSMKIVNADLKGPTYSLDVQILSSYKFIDQGVRGTEGGSGKYAFKTKYPSKKMVAAIERWLKKRGSGGRTKYKAVSKNERKNQRLHKLDKKGIAWGIATNVKKRGIPATKFFTRAVQATQKEVKKKFSEALKVDIINSLS